MANRLEMALVDSILAFHKLGWSQRRIARELNINRETVAHYVKQVRDDSKPAKAPIGSAGADDQPKPAKAPSGSQSVSDGSKPAKAPTGSDEHSQSPPGNTRSDCEPFRQLILDKLDQGLSGQRIWQDLHRAYNFAGSYYSVRRFIKRLGQTTPMPFRRMECAAGEEAQVDFGTGAPIVGADGKRRRTHVFRIVLSHSRKGYSEAVFRQTTDAFLACIENAFHAFGGVPAKLVLDNLRAAVKHPDWYDPELTPKVQAFAQHYGVVFAPTKPYTPRHKGKVERGIDYVKENALKARRFATLEEQNAYLQHWEQTIADTRVHGTTRQQVGRHFETVERPALQPLPLERFPSFQEKQRSVHRDAHVEVEKAYYSVPPEYVGRKVWVRWDSRLVRIFNQRFEQIALHLKQEPGRFCTDPGHILSEKINNVERGADWMLTKIERLGDECLRWAKAVLEERGIEGVRVLQGLLSLANKYRHRQLRRACDIALSYEAFRLRTIRELLKRDENAKQDEFEFTQEDDIIRPLGEYDLFAKDVFADALARKDDSVTRQCHSQSDTPLSQPSNEPADLFSPPTPPEGE